MKKALLIGASMLAMPLSAASAQTAQTQPQPQPQPGPQPAAEVPQDDGVSLADIIVTAAKTETLLQKTPIAITAIEGAALTRAGITNPQDLGKLVPGLQIEQGSSNSSIFIRGVGSRVLSATSDPAVAFSVDGVYFARASGPSTTLFDIARLEVVKGPQGTLYGRNATGGAVNIITNRPVIGRRSLDLTLEAGSYGTVNAQAAVNLPASDRLAFRLAAQSIYNHGYLSDGYSDQNTKAVRASALYEPGADVSIYLSGDYAHQGGQGYGTIPAGPGANNNALNTRFVVPNDPYVGPSDPRVNAFVAAAVPVSAIGGVGPVIRCVGVPFQVGPVPATSAAGTPAILTCTYPLGLAPVRADGFLDNDYYGANVTATARLGFAELTAIGGYRASRVQAKTYPDAKPQLQRIDSDEYTAELRLNSRPDAGSLKWLIGGFYLRENVDSALNISSGNQATSNPLPAAGSPLPATTCLGPLGPPPGAPGVCLANAAVIRSNFIVSDPDLVNETYAGFAQATLSLAEWLRVTAGIRQTHEGKRESNGGVQSFYSYPAGVTTSFPTRDSVTFKNTSYRAGVELDLGPRSMAYATYSTGFHAGGFNQGVAQGPNPYIIKPETVESYVVGIKNRFFDNRLQLNVEAFWLDYANYQTQSLGRINDGTTACSVLGITTACTLNLRTDNAASARVRGVETDVVWRVIRNGTLSANILYNDAKFLNFVVPAFPTGTISYSGLTLNGVSKWTATGSYTQVVPLGNQGGLVLEARTQYRSNAWMFYIHAPGNYQPHYTRTDLSIGYQAPGDAWSLTAYVRNVEDKATLLQGAPIDGATGVPYVTLNPPRTFGAILSAHF